MPSAVRIWRLNCWTRPRHEPARKLGRCPDGSSVLQGLGQLVEHLSDLGGCLVAALQALLQGRDLFVQLPLGELTLTHGRFGRLGALVPLFRVILGLVELLPKRSQLGL